MSSSALPAEMPLINQYVVDTETERLAFAPFYLSETQARYQERWQEFNRCAATLNKREGKVKDADVCKNFHVIQELTWAIEIALLDAAQRFGPEFVSKATLALSKAQRLAVYRLHVLSIAGEHGRDTAAKVEEAEKRSFSVGDNPILDEILRKEAKEKQKDAKALAAKEKAEFNARGKRGGYHTYHDRRRNYYEDFRNVFPHRGSFDRGGRHGYYDQDLSLIHI